MEKFKNRHEAGKHLAMALKDYAQRPDAVVLALPRGGVPVAFEVAKALHLPLDVFIVRKLGVPGHKELAMGAIAEGGIQVLNEDVLRDTQTSKDELEATLASETQELKRREILYRGKRAPLDICNKIVILVDDGIATGASMRAAVKALRQSGPLLIIVAVPVGAADILEKMLMTADKVIYSRKPPHFEAVGLHYEDFTQTTDEEVAELLNQLN
jgi:putative phosphoribosyl transferase